MPDTQPASKLLTRRSALLAGGTVFAGFGGVYGLSRNSTARAEIESNTNLKDASLVLDSDGNVEDVTLSGTVEITYESPDVPVREVGSTASLDYHGLADGDGPAFDRIDAPLTSTQRAPTQSEHNGFRSFSFDGLSLIDGWGFKPSDFEPDPGETVRHEFLLVAEAAIFENVGDDDPLETVASEDSGFVTVERKQANSGGGGEPDQEPLLKLVSSEFSLTVETETA